MHHARENIYRLLFLAVYVLFMFLTNVNSRNMIVFYLTHSIMQLGWHHYATRQS